MKGRRSRERGRKGEEKKGNIEKRKRKEKEKGMKGRGENIAKNK